MAVYVFLLLSALSFPGVIAISVNVPCEGEGGEFIRVPKNKTCSFGEYQFVLCQPKKAETIHIYTNGTTDKGVHSLFDNNQQLRFPCDNFEIQCAYSLNDSWYCSNFSYIKMREFALEPGSENSSCVLSDVHDNKFYCIPHNDNFKRILWYFNDSLPRYKEDLGLKRGSRFLSVPCTDRYSYTYIHCVVEYSNISSAGGTMISKKGLFVILRDVRDVTLPYGNEKKDYGQAIWRASDEQDVTLPYGNEKKDYGQAIWGTSSLSFIFFVLLLVVVCILVYAVLKMYKDNIQKIIEGIRYSEGTESSESTTSDKKK